MSKRKNNDIFNTDLPDQNIRTIKNNKVEEFSWEVPYETVPLPSQGLIYSQDSFFHQKDLIDIKAMTAKEEDILLSQAYLKKGTVVEELIKACVMDNNANVDDLIVGDRNALSIAIRITGYGTDYKASVNCPKCGHTNEKTFDLSELEIKRLGAEPVEPGLNLFEYQLPVSKKIIRFKLMTGKDERDKSEQEEYFIGTLGEMSVGTITSHLKFIIQSIDGITDKGKIHKFVDVMPALDSKKLRNFIRDIQPGIDMNTKMKCDNCSSTSTVSLPVTGELFWPS